MEKEIKREALKQYFRYFRFWFATILVLGVLSIISAIVYKVIISSPRTNTAAPAERVYDYADVLTDSEEESLRKLIAECEKESKADIILVTLSQPMGQSDYEWEQNMMNYADDFYDEGSFGWNMPYGDGSLLLDNWYEGSKGSWLSTSGKMEQIIGSREEGIVFDAMDRYIDTDVCRAYELAVRTLARYGKGNSTDNESPMDLGCMLLVVATIVALVYFISNLHQSKAKDTTNASTYLENGQPRLNTKADTFVRKSLTSHKIQSSSSSGGSSGRRSSGGSHGSHRSSSGHSHGGGGRRR